MDSAASETIWLHSNVWPYMLEVSPTRVNGGTDFQAKQMSGVPSATTIAKYMAITATATAPSATDTVLTGEIVTAGGGLLRATATYAHTAAASTFTLTNTFTVNGSDSIPVTVAQMGIFDTAVSGGVLVFRTLLNATATLSAVGDQLTITETVTM